MSSQATVAAKAGAPRKRMPADARRQTILDAALEGFSKRGLDGVSLDDVAERAGISKALIYEHFASKRDLHDAVLEASHDELVARVLDAIADAEDPEQRLRLGLDAFLRFVEEHRTQWRMVHRNVADPEIAPTLQRVQDEARTTVAALIRAHAPAESPVEGASLALASEMFAQQLVGAGQAIANWWDDHREIPREVILQAHMDFAWLGLERLVAGERWRG
jgi:AcrR family transcriptional regulator